MYEISSTDNGHIETITHGNLVAHLDANEGVYCYTFENSSCGQENNAHLFEVHAINCCATTPGLVGGITILAAPQAQIQTENINVCVGQKH